MKYFDHNNKTKKEKKDQTHENVIWSIRWAIVVVVFLQFYDIKQT